MFQCVQFLFDQLVACDMWLTAIKVALISGHTELHDAIIKELAMQDQVSTAMCQSMMASLVNVYMSDGYLIAEYMAEAYFTKVCMTDRCLSGVYVINRCLTGVYMTVGI